MIELENLYPGVQTPIRWVGNLRQVSKSLVDQFPGGVEFHDPMVGGSAFVSLFGDYFSEVHVSDLNPHVLDLIQYAEDITKAYEFECYDYNDELEEYGKANFTSVRKEFNELLVSGEDDVRKSLLFAILVRSTYSGIVRFSRSGTFTGSFGKGRICGPEPWEDYAEEVADWNVHPAMDVCEYLETVPNHGSWILIHPPDLELFTDYTAKKWTQLDNVRLGKSIAQVTKRGCNVVYVGTLERCEEFKGGEVSPLTTNKGRIKSYACTIRAKDTSILPGADDQNDVGGGERSSL